ncbi:transposase, partial [Microbacterium aurantiacum]|uniref:transposase n=1 Tax=Microbacterium aurantiacum TaxID=162393 RepID=UPI00403775BB
ADPEPRKIRAERPTTAESALKWHESGEADHRPQRAADVLAYFERPGTSNGPTEALNGRLEHLRGSALGFRNLTNYIARSLLETDGFRPQLLHPRLR